MLAVVVEVPGLMQPEQELELGPVQPQEPVHWAGSPVLQEGARTEPLLEPAPQAWLRCWLAFVCCSRRARRTSRRQPKSGVVRDSCPFAAHRALCSEFS